MKAEIITVGSELLLGTFANSNLMTICRELDEIGVEVAFATTVRDLEPDIAETIVRAAGRTDAVIITGGLGPTHDDLTREAISAVTGQPLEFHGGIEAELVRFFEARGGPMNELNLRQAYVPAGATAVPNPLGTAPGIALDHHGVPVFALPGVPAEMLRMLRDHVLPTLAGRSVETIFATRTLRAVGKGESDIAGMIAPVVDACRAAGTPTVTILASRGEVCIHLRAGGPDRAAGMRVIDPIDERLRNVLGDLIYGRDQDTLQGVVVRAAGQRRLTLAVAESFTGGALAARIVEVPGASEVLKAGFVTYAIEAKVGQLGVSPQTLQEHGAVSEETARAMAEGARIRAGTSLGLSATGEAGPDPQEKPVGTMFVGLSWEGGSVARGFVAAGSRQAIRDWGTNAALDALRRWLLTTGEVSG